MGIEPKTLTFEEVETQLAAVDLRYFKDEVPKPGPKTRVVAQVDPLIALVKIAKIYKVVRPILLLVSTLPLLPIKWRTALGIFLRILDTLASGAVPP